MIIWLRLVQAECKNIVPGLTWAGGISVLGLDHTWPGRGVVLLLSMAKTSATMFHGKVLLWSSPYMPTSSEFCRQRSASFMKCFAKHKFRAHEKANESFNSLSRPQYLPSVPT